MRKITLVQLVAIILFVIGIVVATIGYSRFEDFFANVSTDLISISITVLIIDTIYHRQFIEQEKQNLIGQVGSPVNSVAREAARVIREKGWLDILEGKNLCYADLREAELHEMKLRNVNFAYAKLSRANFNGSNLEGAIFDCDLKEAMFHNANLSRCKISSTDLSIPFPLKDADLYLANLEGAEFFDINIRDGKYNDMDLILHVVSRLEGAKMPNGNRYNGKYNLQGDYKVAIASGININNNVEMAKFYGVSLEDYLVGQKWHAESRLGWLIE